MLCCMYVCVLCVIFRDGSRSTIGLGLGVMCYVVVCMCVLCERIRFKMYRVDKFGKQFFFEI